MKEAWAFDEMSAGVIALLQTSLSAHYKLLTNRLSTPCLYTWTNNMFAIAINIHKTPGIL